MSPRPPAVVGEAIVATSQPLATRAGLRALERGGNAADAVLGAAAVVPEPDRTRFGGGQAILVECEVLLGCSDARKDGFAAGL